MEFIKKIWNSINKRNIFAVTTFSLISLMVLITLGGMVIFKAQFDKSNSVEDREEYVKYDRYYAMITSDDRADFWQAVYNGAREEGTNESAYVEFFAGDMGARYSMEERMEIAIAADVDGIILEGEDNDSLRSEIRKAGENGIPVVVVNQDVVESGRISFVGIGRYDLGQTYGRQTCELAEEMLKARDVEKHGEGPGEKLQIRVLISQEADSNGQNLMMSGIREAIGADETLENRIELDTCTIDDSGAFTAEESIRDIFMGQDDVPDILVCLTEIYTTCAYQAVIDYNRVGITNIIGYYDSDTIRAGVEKEVIYCTISMDAEQMGRYCVYALSEFLDVEHVSEYFSVDTYVVNKENVGGYGGDQDYEE